MNKEEANIKYGLVMGRRYKQKEKELFLNEIGKEFIEMGYSVRVLTSKLKRFSGTNMYIGDVEKAKNLVIAHYDTPLNTFNPDYKFNPFDIKLSNKNSMSMLRRLILAVFVTGVAIILFANNFLGIEGRELGIMMVVTSFIITILGYFISKSVGNPLNHNLNTSGVIGVLQLAAEKTPNTAYILTDRECLDNMGDVMIQNALPTSLKDKTIIHLRMIGNGDKIGIGFSEENKKLAKKMGNSHKDIIYVEMPEDKVAAHSLGYYEKAISISAVKEFEGIIEVPEVSSNKDTKIDWVIFTNIIDMVHDFLVRS